MAVLLAALPSFAPLRAQTLEVKENVLKNYGKLPLHFEANVGQSSPEVKFLAHGLGYGLFLTQDGAVLAMLDASANDQLARTRTRLPEARKLLAEIGDQPERSASVLRMAMVGANPAARISGVEQLPGRNSYFIGNDQKKWRSNLSTYAKVKYSAVYPGVDLIYYGNQGRLEYDFVVAPAADPNRIRLAIRQVEDETKTKALKLQRSLRIDKNGDLVVATRAGEVRYQKPVAYQVAPDGGERIIPARFELKSKGSVGFVLGAYDHAKDLVIDPTLIYSTYVAGASPGPYYFGYTGDQAAAIAVDANGSAYITGLTESADFPITPNAFQATCKPFNQGCSGVPNSNPSFSYAVFISKLSPDGSSLVYSTYLGGGYSDNGAGIAVDSSGNAYIAGSTNSPDFPVTPGAYQTTCGPELDQLHGFCTPSGIVSKCGPQGTPDGFITKLNPSGSALVYSTFVGGSLNDYLTGIAVNSAGEAYVSGFTLSSYGYGGLYYGCGPDSATAAYGYPITPGGYYPGPLPAPPAGQPWPFGSPSAFTAAANSVTNYPFGGNHTPVFSKLSADGSTMLYSTYIGGGLGPAFPSPGSQTLGDGQTFYPYLQQHATGIAVDGTGNAYLTGWSNASDQCCTQFNNYQFSGFPTTAGVVQPHNASDCNGNCNYDGFVAKFDPTQAGVSSLVYSTNLGGRGDDYANAIALDSAGNAYVTGTANTSSNGAPATFPTTEGTVQPNCPGSCSSTYGWVAKLNSTATAQDYGTYLSGTTGTTTPSGITVDSAGNAFVAGQTGNNGFPQQNAVQGYPGGALTSAFVSVLDPTASTLLFSSFLGSDNQAAYANNGAVGIALDSTNNIYVTGSTTSSRFPTTPGAFQTSCDKCSAGSWGVFVAEISTPTPGVAPTITSAGSITFQAGSSDTFTVTATGTPVPSLSESGSLPGGVTFADSGNGTATLSGTATAGGTFNITLTAHNGVNPDATQNFTLTVRSLQSIAVSPNPASIMKGATQAFTASGTYSDNTIADLTSSVTWSSSDLTVATIATTGVATGVKVGGPVTITAVKGSVSGTASLTVTAPALQSITVTPATASITAGLTQQFTATGHYSDGSTQNLTAVATWSSSSGIASISNSAGTQGLARGLAAGGPVTITATQGAMNGTASLTVTAATLVSIAVTPPNPSILTGNAQQFAATGSYTDGSVQNITNSVTWTSSNVAVASINASGLASAVSAGSTNISAKQGNVSGSTMMTVITLQSLTIAPLNASVFVGSTLQFAATGHYSDGSTRDLTSAAAWSSSKTSVASITSPGGGLATGKAKGSTTIKATAGGFSASTTLTVSAVVLVSISVTPSAAIIHPRGTQQFMATGNYNDGTSKDITNTASWSSSAKMVASVNNTGLATAGSKTGTATIIAKSGMASGSATLTVQ